jgi:hypothetical protein
MVDIYIALLRADGTEPDPESGYRRVSIGVYDIVSKPDIFGGRQIVFPEAQGSGYGSVYSVAVCDQPEGGQYLRIWNFSAAQDCHAGVVPLIYNGQLFRGMEVQAVVNLKSADLFGGM